MKNKGDSLFMSSVAFMFLLAFWSALVQNEGIAEVRPGLLRDGQAEIVSRHLVLGSLLSIVVCALPLAQCSVAFGALFVMYRDVMLAQFPFTSFQWDALLLEVLLLQIMRLM